jgi:hypothetical protein
MLNILDLEQKKLTFAHPTFAGENNWMLFNWTPASDKVVFPDEFNDWLIYNTRSDKIFPVTLSGGNKVAVPSWSFDGQFLSFYRRTDGPMCDTVIFKSP